MTFYLLNAGFQLSEKKVNQASSTGDAVREVSLSGSFQTVSQEEAGEAAGGGGGMA